MSSRSLPRIVAISFFLFCISLLLVILPLIANAALVSSTIGGTVIAYVSSSTDNQAIRVINSDGSGGRSLWRIPSSSHPLDGIGSLSWRPDGAELLFDSGHDWQRSMAIRDLYAVAPDGSGLRRVSSPPGPEGYAAYPTGTVTFIVDALEEGDAQVYIQGAAAPVEYVARSAESYRFTITVADLGPGIRQNIRVWDPDALDYPCLYSEEAWADVAAGQTVDLGVIYFAPATSDQACWHMFSPSWSYDSNRLLYLFREPTPFALPNNNIWQIAARAPNNQIGTRVLDMGEFVNPGRLYRVVFGPTAVRGDEMLFLQNESLIDLLWHATTANVAGRRQIDLGVCPRLSCELLDVAWLPDGSGFIVARYETLYKSGGPPEGGVLYRYHFDDGELSEILRLPGEVIGKLAVAPDGTSIVFERGERLVDSVTASAWGPAVQCPCALWQVNSDGSDVRQLVADGRAPAWSLVAPQVQPAPDLPARLWLPLLRVP
jgi:WD40 repeat protein